jgi:hypothetical protein
MLIDQKLHADAALAGDLPRIAGFQVVNPDRASGPGQLLRRQVFAERRCS